MLLRYALSLIVCLFVLGSLQAQTISNARTKVLSSHQDSIFLDSLMLIPESLELFSKEESKIDASFYTLSPSKSYVVFTKKLPAEAFPIEIKYRIFPFNLSAKYYHKKWKTNPANKLKQQGLESYYRYQIQKEDGELLGLSDYQKSGNISRAISVGNSQDLSVLSNMNLQIAGKLSEELEIIASISDDNIPIQPEGNTQQLQDFDKVFIQLKHQNGQVTVGDFEMHRPKSYFLNYHKKAQGANASVHVNLSNNQKLDIYGGAALSRGKYARNIINGIEGNQGPYKLTGTNFERAIIVLSGTEQVYVDGKLMKRGQNYDYIIDYNTAEITFMPTVPINKDKRISVEFQYSDRNYARYLANFGFEYFSPKWKLATHYYIESDLKNQALDQELSEEEEQLLYDIGDSLHLAITPAIDSIGFNGNEVLYKMVDSMGYTVYVHSFSPDSAFYRLSFSLVGIGNGDYIQEKSSANGRVFKWVAPVDGIRQGEYAPAVLLVSPKKKQMVSTLAEYQLAKNTALQAEVAYSDQDVNTFSPYDEENNTAPAVKLKFHNTLNLSQKDEAWQLNTIGKYEYVNANFSPIERFREVEFERDWNAKNTFGKDQQIGEIAFRLQQNKRGYLGYEFQSFLAEEAYQGARNRLTADLNKNKWFLEADLSLTTTKEVSMNTDFLRHRISLEKRFRKLYVGILEYAEDNEFKPFWSDSLYANSIRFQEVEAYIQSPDTLKSRLRMHYKWREDFLPLAHRFNKTMEANEFGFELSLMESSHNRLKLMANYRQLEVIDSTLTTMKPEETSMGRLEHILNIANGSIRAQTFYQLGSGMETKRDFSYLEVAPGQGVYAWNDYNDNGVKELDEFEVAVFQDQANFIRIYTPGNTYIKTFNNQFSTSINLKPSIVWRRSNVRVYRIIALFSNQLVYRSSLKTLNDELVKYGNPFKTDLESPLLINLNSSFRNTFYFNRGHAKYGADYTFLSNKSKILMMNGYESRDMRKHQLKLRWNISKQLLFQYEGSRGEELALSDYFKNREYDILFYENEIRLSFQPNRVFRISIPTSLGRKQNTHLQGGEESESFKLGINAKYSLLSKGSWTASLQQVKLTYNSEVNGNIAFEMLEGLLPGTNYVWQVGYQRNLLNNLQLNIMYNGRKSESTNIIHVGSVQLRAFF